MVCADTHKRSTWRSLKKLQMHCCTVFFHRLTVNGLENTQFKHFLKLPRWHEIKGELSVNDFTQGRNDQIPSEKWVSMWPGSILFRNAHRILRLLYLPRSHVAEFPVEKKKDQSGGEADIHRKLGTAVTLEQWKVTAILIRG